MQIEIGRGAGAGFVDMSRWRPEILRDAGLLAWGVANLAAAALYCTLGWAVSQFFAKFGIFPAPIWLPASIGIVAAMIGGVRMVPGLFLGSLVANYVLFAPPLGEAVLISLSNALGPVLGAEALRRLRPDAGLFNRMRGIAAFVVCAVILHPALTATGGALTVLAYAPSGELAFPGLWLQWWLSDSGGSLFFAPALLLWLGMEREELPRNSEAMARDWTFWTLVVLSVAMLVTSPPLEGAIRWAFPFLLVVPVSWIALCVSLRAAYTLIVTVSVMASAGAMIGFGPFREDGIANPMQLVGVLVVLLALNVLTIVALAAERRAAEAANRAKSARLASATHDLRTPLNAILGFSDIMKREVLGPLATPRYREYVGHIHDSGRMLMDIIDNILDLSKIEAGRHDVAPGILDAEAVASSCIEIVSLKAQERGIRLSFDAEPGIAAYADEGALRQILINLIANGVNYTPAGGGVTVRLGISAQGETVLSVADTGVGMTAEEVEIALQPFGRIARANAAPEKGTGLGLPIAQRLAELHGGTLTVDSQPGVGTTVRVTLPPSPAHLAERSGGIAAESRPN